MLHARHRRIRQIRRIDIIPKRHIRIRPTPGMSRDRSPLLSLRQIHTDGQDGHILNGEIERIGHGQSPIGDIDPF
jgi:hypothetical protein